MSALSGQQASLPVPVNPRVAGLPPVTEAPLSKRYRVVRSALQRESIPVLFRDWNWFPLLFAASIVAGVAPHCRHG